MMHRAIPLIKEEIVLAVNEENPLSQKKTVSIRDLRQERIISMPRQSSLYSTLYDSCHRFGFEPKVPVVCDDPYFIRKYVSENIGVALAPSISWKGRFCSNTVLIPLRNPTLYITSYLLYDDKQYRSHATKRFINFLLDEASQIEGNLSPLCEER